ncbi:isocitrate lyase/PEP mutase family protein [Nonomuraea diastatica]|uniref:Isocitrate lyase/PEP mutase family protein n=1 Tax=Nonomuraea diastatica TaxID=1848329 RepID=A0A4R4W8H3_9ACTN|nr:isocitrate lyase/PEP mutase family protein [Nonomuraea diastatica]
MSSSWAGGIADVGWLAMTEVVQQCRTIADSVDSPIFCDADTGYGSAVNTRRIVQEFIRAGVAGQEEPKKVGGQAGIRLVPDAEAIGRLQAAVDARDELDEGIVIVARTDGYGAEGGSLEDAIRRGVLYKRETGADVIFYEGAALLGGGADRARRAPRPGVRDRLPAGGPDAADRHTERVGQAIQVPSFILPAVLEVWRLLEAGEPVPIDDYNAAAFEQAGREDYVGYGDVFVRPGYDDVWRWRRSTTRRRSVATTRTPSTIDEVTVPAVGALQRGMTFDSLVSSHVHRLRRRGPGHGRGLDVVADLPGRLQVGRGDRPGPRAARRAPGRDGRRDRPHPLLRLRGLHPHPGERLLLDVLPGSCFFLAAAVATLAIGLAAHY